MNTVWLGLGSNMGDRQSHIEAAVARLGEILADMQVAPIYDTKPLDYLNQSDFLNTVARGKTSLTPQKLLEKTRKIERSIGRKRTIEKGPRAIDIDILVYENICENYKIDPKNYLTIPHERMHARLFVLRPLLDIDSDLVDPRDGVPWSAKAEKITDQLVEPW